MNITPINDRVIIKLIDQEKSTTSGIILHESAIEKPSTGEVIALGPGTKDYVMNVKLGDKVLFGKYSGQTFKIGKEEYFTMREDEIIGVINE